MISRSEFRRLNERRLDLIVRKHEAGITAAESVELDSLKAKTSEYMRVRHPRDTALQDDASARIAELKAKIAARKGEAMKRIVFSVALLLCLPSLASAQLLDGQREQHRQEPAYNGSNANAPIPANLHVRNEGGSDGAGLCVIASLRINGRYQGVPGVEQIWAKAKTRPGGYSPDKLQGLLDEVVPNEKWASYVGRDTGILDQLSKAGYPIGATMNTGELYGYQPIHHMVSLVHYDKSKGMACVVDNNRPGVFSWMTSGEFDRRWIDGGTGWAFVWTRKAALMAKAAGGVILLAALAAVGLIVTGRRDHGAGGATA